MKSYSTTPSLLTTLAFSALVFTSPFASAATPFTIAVIGDQQVPVNRDNYTQFYTSFTAQTDWIAANAQANKIRFVTQVGDIIEHGDDLAEFSRAEAAMATLDTATNADGGTGMPWNVNYGNHEVNWGAPGSDPAGADADNYRDYFGSGSGTHRYAGQPEYGGVSSNDLNTWHIIKASNAIDAREYLMLNLEYDVPGHAPGSTPNPADVPAFDAIAWAWDIIAQHPGMPTIITTHVFEGTQHGPPNNPYTSGPGRNSQLQIFDKLVKDNPQIFMVLSGHTSQDSHQVKTNTAGLKVLQMVTDYNKVRPNGGDGFFRLVELDEDAGEIRVQTYTPGVPQNPTPRFDTSANGEFTVTMDWVTRFPAPSGLVMGPPSITNVTDDGATIESQLTNVDADDVTLVWAYADQGETDIATWTSAPGGGSHSFGSAVADEVLSRVLSGLDGDTTYRVRFFATGGGDSDWSSAAAFATGLGGLPAPGSFAGVPGTGPGGTKVDLSWTDGFDNESGFVIRRSDDPGFGTYDEFTVGADATSYTDDATAANTTYYYRIAGTGSTGAGTFSANIEVTTGDAGSGPTAGLVGHWKFDEGSGTIAADSSAFGRDADRIVAAGAWVAGKNGGAYNLPRFALDASESNALNLAGGGAVSVSAWITNRTGTASFEGIAGFEKSGGSTGDVYSLKMDNTDKINWTVLPSHGPLASADTLANYAAATADGWVHVVGVFEQGVGSTLYVNGAVAASTSATASPIGTETTAFAIGSYDNGGNGFTGSVDDVRVYNVALTATDVADLGDLGGGDPVAPQVVRGPYLQSAGHDRMTVRWRTNIAGIGVVRYGTTAGVLDQSTSPGTAETEHVVPITGLTPDTVYYYEIETQNGTAIGTVGDNAEHFFKTHPTPGTSEPSRIWVIGDSGTTTTAKQDVYDAYRNRGEDTDVWLMLGDNAYNNGTDAEFQAAVFDSYPEFLRNTPLWSCIGNHEAYTSGGQPYLDLHTFPTAGESGGVASGTERYYSFDYGDIHFVCIDSQTAGNYDDAPGGGGMVDWLELDLQATDKNWIIAYFHHGPYTKGSHDSDTETQHIVMRQYVVPLLEQYGVDLVLSGHSHCYERSMLINGHHSAMSTADSTSGTFDPLAHVIDGGNGSAVGSVDGSGSFVTDGGDGIYNKLTAIDDVGTVYSTCGASGKLSAWDNGSTAIVNPEPHPVYIVNLRVMGSMIIDVDGSTLHARYIDGSNVVRDDFTIEKAGNGPYLGSTSVTAVTDDGATVECQLLNAAADQATLAWAFADQGTNSVADWTSAPGGGSHSFGSAVQDEVLSRLLTGLDGDSFYSFRFFASAGPDSDWSAEGTFATGLAGNPAPSGLSAVAGTTVSTTKVDLSWTDSFTTETGFLIQRSTDPGFATVVEFSLAANQASFTDDTTLPNTTYHYRIAAVGSSGTGAFSSAVTVTTGDEPSVAPQVLRGPYLQAAADDRITIRWRTDIAGVGVVRYGTAPGSLSQSASTGTAQTEHIVPITGLTANTVYYYEIETQNGTAVTSIGGDVDHTFKTHPTPGSSEPTRVWVIGDSGTTTTAKQDVYDAYRNRGEDTDVWLMLGDNAYNSGTDAEFQAAVFDSYPELLRNTPLWSCIGNHEAYTSGGQPYLDLHTFPTAGESGGIASGTERYYSFDHGNIHFVCIDSETSGNYNDVPGGGGMVDWLELDLQATDKDWIIAYFHHGPYTKGSHDSDTETQHIVMRRYVVPLLEQYGVDLVLSGHSHCYERSMLINGHHSAMSTADSTSSTFDPGTHVVDGGNGSAVGSVDGSGSFVVDGGDGVYEKLPPLDKIGTVYSTCGASGKLSSWDNGSNAVVNPAPHPVFMVNLRVMGSMIIDVDGETLNARYIDGSNAVRDDFTIRKIGAGLYLSAAATTAFADDGATVESQLYNVDADEVTVVWAYADQGETTVAGWTSAPGGGSHSFGATSQDTVLSRVLTGLDGDSAYSVRFFATAGGESSWSAPENFVTGLGASPAPSSLSAVAGTTATSTKVDLTWTDSFTNETGFLIQRSTDPGFATYDEFPVAANLEVYTDDTTAANTAYHYRIAGIGSSGTGTFSAGVQVATGEDPGGTPVASLIGHWTFDEGSGTTAADSSANGNTATLAGSAGSWVTGESGSAYQLTDPVSRFEIGDSSDLQVTGAVTVSAWVKPFAASRYGLIAGVDQTGGTGSDMYALKTGVSDTLNWQVIGASSSVSLNGATLMSLSNSGANWVHVVGVYDPSGFAGLYVNGGLVDSTTTGVPTSIQSMPATPFQMGYNASDGGDGGSNGLDSAVDDVQVYDQALTATEVAFLYNNPGSPISLPPSAPFEEWATTNISDIDPSADATFGGNPDGDPFANGLEWALGGNPLGFDSMADLLGHAGNTTTGLTLSFTREDTSEGEANLAIEFSSDLFDADVNVSPIPAASGTSGGVSYTITENGSGPDGITATIPAGNAVDGRLFGRIRATEN